MTPTSTLSRQITAEQWAEITGYRGHYAVSDQGRVLSLARVITRRDGTLHRITERILAGTPNREGYPQVHLCRGGRQQTCKVHTLVAAAFVGPRPPGLEVCHRNGKLTDNRATNLEYGTHSRACRERHRTRERARRHLQSRQIQADSKGDNMTTATMTAERWQSITDHPGYEVSDQGRVRSLARTITRSSGRRYSVPRRLLEPFANSRGYLCVSLSRADVPSKRRNAPVHALVLAAFTGPRPDGLVSRHLNGDRTDNRAANLAWGTVTENNRDTVAHGHNRNAARTHCPAGHPYDAENTAHRSTGGRRCRACNRGRSEQTGPGRNEVHRDDQG